MPGIYRRRRSVEAQASPNSNFLWTKIKNYFINIKFSIKACKNNKIIYKSQQQKNKNSFGHKIRNIYTKKVKNPKY